MAKPQFKKEEPSFESKLISFGVSGFLMLALAFSQVLKVPVLIYVFGAVAVAAPIALIVGAILKTAHKAGELKAARDSSQPVPAGATESNSVKNKKSSFILFFVVIATLAIGSGFYLRMNESVPSATTASTTAEHVTPTYSHKSATACINEQYARNEPVDIAKCK